MDGLGLHVGYAPRTDACHLNNLEQLNAVFTSGSFLALHGHLEPLCVDLTPRAVMRGAVDREGTCVALTPSTGHRWCRRPEADVRRAGTVELSHGVPMTLELPRVALGS